MPPISSVLSLPSQENTPGFVVCWSGTDVGSGIIGYDVYAATNSGAWTLWLAATTNTCEVFPGRDGQSYGFYSVAHDGAGNTENKLPTVEASTTVHIGIQAPQFQAVTRNGNTILLHWNAIPGRTYQMQYATNLAAATWSSVGAALISTNSVLSTSDVLGPDQHRYYRVVLLP